MSVHKETKNYKFTFNKTKMLVGIKFLDKKKYKLSEYGKINFTPMIGSGVIGKSVPSFGKGQYYIYKSNGNIIISKIKLNNITDIDWKYEGGFKAFENYIGFWNLPTIKEYNKIIKKATGSKSKNEPNYIPRPKKILNNPIIKIKNTSDITKKVNISQLYKNNDIIGIAVKITPKNNDIYNLYKYQNKALMIITNKTRKNIDDEFRKFK